MSKFSWPMKACALFLLWATAAIALPAQTLFAQFTVDGKGSAGSVAPLIQAAEENLYETLNADGLNDCDGFSCDPVFEISLGGDLTPHLHRFDQLHSFSGYPVDGFGPGAALVQGTDGSLYGTTTYGGAYSSEQCFEVTQKVDTGCGTVYKLTTSGKVITLYSFCAQSNCADGFIPSAAVVQATSGDFYGTTALGGIHSNQLCTVGSGTAGPFACGTVFRITRGGALTTLYNFCSQGACADGAVPDAGLIQATDGNFYGTTETGGANGDGTVFKITPSGTLTTLHSFDNTDGAYPYAGLVQGADGNFYGTTSGGGAYDLCAEGGSGCGTVFRITPGGTLTTLHSFAGYPTDGAQPYGEPLIQATNGDFYGTTQYGGANAYSTCQPTAGCGTVFNITPGGILTTIYSFCKQSNCTDGTKPYAGLIQATDGNFYGTTGGGGADGDYGTVFQITPSGTVTTLVSFNQTNGQDPAGAVVQDTNGVLYGTTYYGGASNDGIAFSLSVGLDPFVETQPTSGALGETVKILGTNLTGATSVMFSGTPATFTVVSASEITTTVPTGATTGIVQVVTPTATLSSNVPFRVWP